MAKSSEPNKDGRSSKEIAPQLDAANQKVEAAQKKLDAATAATFDALSAEVEAAVKQRNIVKKQFDTAVSRENKATSTVAATNEAAANDLADLRAKGAETIRRRQESADMAKKAWQKNSDTVNNKNLFNAYQKALGELSVKFDEYAAKGVVFPRTAEVDPAGGFRVPAVVGNGKATVGVGTPAVVPNLGRGTVHAPTTTVIPGTTTGTGTGTGITNTTVIPPPFVPPVIPPVVPGTGASVIPPAVVPPVVAPVDDPNAWETIFKTNEPGYAWMFTDEMKTKYPDVFDLFKKASAPGYDQTLFARQFTGTSWYKTLAEAGTGRELTAGIGSFSWGAGNLAKFLTNATHMGFTGENLKAEAYKALFSKGADGKFVNDLAVGEVKASTPYLKLKKIGSSFFAPMSDERIVESLTGGISSDDVLRLARERAKVMYPHLAASIDAGLTLEDLAYDYKNIAAKTLELSPDQVDMSSAKFNKAMKTGDGGKERMMSTGEWEQLLRTDPTYNYHMTKQANRDATDIGLAISRAFGKVE